MASPLLLPALIGAGATLGGAALGARAQGKAANAQNALIQAELARRNQMQQFAMPGILRALGYARPQRVLGASSRRFPPLNIGRSL